MRSQGGVGWVRTVSRFALVAVIGGLAAGCSSDAMRFAEGPFGQGTASREPALTGSIPAEPAAPARRAPLPAPPPQFSSAAEGASPVPAARQQVAAVTPRPATSPASGPSGWSAAGGTRVRVGEGDGVQGLATRYGVPASAILSANNLTAAQVTPGREVVIPVYNAGGAGASMTPRPEPARVAERPAATPIPREAGARALEVQVSPPRAGRGEVRAAEAKLEAKAESKTKPESKAKPEAKAKPETGSEARTRVRPGQSLAQASPPKPAPSKPEPRQAEAKAPVKAKPEAKVEAKAETKAEARTRVRPGQVAAAPAKPEAPVRQAAKPEPEKPRVRPGQATAAKPQEKPAPQQVAAAPKARPEAAPKVEAKTEVKPAAKPAEERPVAAAKPAPQPAKPAAPTPEPPRQVASAPAPAPAQPTPQPAEPPKARDVDTTASTPAASFRWPARGRVINGFGAGDNQGINIALPEGTPVRAADGGTVTYAGSEVRGYGNLVLIKHDNGYVSAYAHNGELSVKRGEKVTRGQQIAKSGQTGNVTSPQLHFELRRASTPVDPTPLLSN